MSSAGTGVSHSEYNKNQDKPVKFLQIWVFPNKRNVAPRYDQISVRELEQENAFYQVLSPSPDDQGVWVHQDAWFHLGKFAPGAKTAYQLRKPGNGMYLFVLEGAVTVEGQPPTPPGIFGRQRNGRGVWFLCRLNIPPGGSAEVLRVAVKAC